MFNLKHDVLFARLGVEIDFDLVFSVYFINFYHASELISNIIISDPNNLMHDWTSQFHKWELRQLCTGKHFTFTTSVHYLRVDINRHLWNIWLQFSLNLFVYSIFWSCTFDEHTFVIALCWRANWGRRIHLEWLIQRLTRIDIEVDFC